MLLPIAMSIIDMMGEKADCKNSDFSVCLLLGLAYAASIGGIGTIVGTAPNVFVVSFIQSQMGREISFVKWMMIALPLVVVFLPVTWWLLCRVIFSISRVRLPDIDALLMRLNAELGPMRREEVMTIDYFRSDRCRVGYPPDAE